MSPRLSFHFGRRLTIALAIALLLASAAQSETPDKKIAIVSADFSERAGLFFVAKD